MWVYVEYTGQAGAEAAGNTDPTPIHVSLRGKHKKFQFVTEFPSPLAWLDNGGERGPGWSSHKPNLAVFMWVAQIKAYER